MMFLYQEFPLKIYIHICVVTKGVTEEGRFPHDETLVPTSNLTR